MNNRSRGKARLTMELPEILVSEIRVIADKEQYTLTGAFREILKNGLAWYRLKNKILTETPGAVLIIKNGEIERELIIDL